MKFPRASGLLLHVTSLSGEYGIGDLGPAAYSFVDFLSAAKQSYWQILPLGPTGYGDSPYQPFSAFAGNTLLISPEMLVEAGLLTDRQINDRPNFPDDRVEYGQIYEWKNALLNHAFRCLGTNPNSGLPAQFEAFRQENAWWLDDYALYRAIRAANGSTPWYEWPAPLKLREPGALQDARNSLENESLAEKFYQFLFFRQWKQLKDHANERNVRIIGDVPIFVSLDSSDVWCNQNKFKLNPDGSPKVVAGVPPDYFSSTGQLWGNPIYDWEEMARDDFQWWAARVAFTLRNVDIARIDHFRGFVGTWEVPGTDSTAEFGRWADVPGRELFDSLRRHLGDLPLIAEDLGVITPEVEHLRESNGFPGMKVLEFAFGGDATSDHLPHNYARNCVAYTGTHDNDTVAGWRQARLGNRRAKKAALRSTELEYCLKYLNTSGKNLHCDFIRAIWASVADTAIAPVQDVLGLGNEARMNLPATGSGNWSWRLTDGVLDDALAQKLRDLTVVYGR